MLEIWFCLFPRPPKDGTLLLSGIAKDDGRVHAYVSVGCSECKDLISALSLNCCVTLNKSLNLSGNIFPICKTKELDYMIFKVPSSPDILYSVILFT